MPPASPIPPMPVIPPVLPVPIPGSWRVGSGIMGAGGIAGTLAGAAFFATRFRTGAFGRALTAAFRTTLFLGAALFRVAFFVTLATFRRAAVLRAPARTLRAERLAAFAFRFAATLILPSVPDHSKSSQHKRTTHWIFYDIGNSCNRLDCASSRVVTGAVPLASRPSGRWTRAVTPIVGAPTPRPGVRQGRGSRSQMTSRTQAETRVLLAF